MGVFIKALHKQICELHTNMRETGPSKFYREMIVPTAVFEEIQRKPGGLLSINAFLSTSREKDVAIFVLLGYPLDKTAILFEIVIDRSVPTNVFYVSVQSVTQFRDEYLFNMGSVFHILSIGEPDENGIRCIHLALMTDHDSELALFICHIQSELPKPSLISLCSVLLYMCNFEKIVEIDEIGVKTSNESLDLCTLHALVGFAYLSMGYYQKAITKFESSKTGTQYGSCMSTIGSSSNC